MGVIKLVSRRPRLQLSIGGLDVALPRGLGLRVRSASRGSVEFNDNHKTRVASLEELKSRPLGEDCLVVIHAPVQSELGRRHMLNRPQITIGRGRDNDIVLSSDCVSRNHARLEHRGETLHVIDLTSTNGTFVNDESQRVTDHQLRRGDQLAVGDTIFKFLSGSDVEAQYHEIVFRMAITDGLTNLCNRKQLDTLLAEEVPRAQRYSRELSLLMLDIDHFKSINDTHGHLTGDSVLRALAAILQKRLRPNDKLGRYGGEEFCAILPETSLASAVKIGEELRQLVAEHRFMAESQELKVTISIGAAVLGSDMAALDLYRRADEMLYRAKHAGRNRICWQAAVPAQSAAE
jgi:diguanylate cyclase (GGDEF)-like protein